MSFPEIAGLIIGMVLGLGFTGLQWLAQARHAQRGVTSRWSLVPGSMTRVAVLLAGLAAAQILVPGISLWHITIGLVVALMVPMALRLRRMATTAAVNR